MKASIQNYATNTNQTASINHSVNVNHAANILFMVPNHCQKSRDSAVRLSMMTSKSEKGFLVAPAFASSSINILRFADLAIDSQLAGPSATLQSASLILLPDKPATSSQTSLHGRVVLCGDPVAGVSTPSRPNWRR